MKSKVPDDLKTQSTRDKIVLESAILFARRGYAAVTIKDIVARVGISPSSLYYHFKSKEEVFEEILKNARDLYSIYFRRLEKSMETTTCFGDVLNCLFTELLEVYDIYIYYCITLITTEQFRDKKARGTFDHDIMGIGIECSKKMLDRSIERGWVKPFNTEIFAISLMNNVIVGNLMRTHENMNYETTYKPGRMFLELREMMLHSVEVIK